MFPVSGVGKASADILSGEDREVDEKVLLAHASGEIPQHVTNRKARSAHHRLSEADFGVEDDALMVVGGNQAMETRVSGAVGQDGSRGDIPLQPRIEEVGDDADLKEVYDTERQLLYVACTRARDNLLVTSVAPGSEFLDDLRS